MSLAANPFQDAALDQDEEIFSNFKELSERKINYLQRK